MVPNFDDGTDRGFVHSYVNPHYGPAAQNWIREMYGSQDSTQSAAARALRQENARRTMVHLKSHWLRPTRAG